MHTFKSFVAERSLTQAEKDKAEKIVKGMKKGKAGFQARYGDKAKSVMYATATKLAKEEVQLDELKASTLGNYVVTAAGDLRHQSAADAKYQKDFAQSKDPAVKKALGTLILKKTHNINKRREGINRAITQLTKKDHMVTGTGELRKLKAR